MNTFPLMVALAATLAAPAAQAIPLTPLVSGTFTDGDGANSRWVQVSDSWLGSIHGTETWGTGIWGLADHAMVMGLSSGHPDVVRTHTGTVSQINFADEGFISFYGTSWASPALAPLFNGGEGQDNWAVSFTGYLAIPTTGFYNFGVLYDDGFRFTLNDQSGSNSLVKDGLNPRDRLGFASDLELTAGLYSYTLDAYERLEVSAIQLAWFTPGASDWSVIPQSQLYTTLPSPVPEPSQAVLLASGLLGMFAWRRARRTV